MQEEPDGSGLGKLSSQHLREEHQVVVVDEDDIPFLVDRGNGVSEALVNGDILFVGR